MECTLKTLGSPPNAQLWRGRVFLQQLICDETCYHPGKNQVWFLLRGFVLGANKASWLSGQRVRLSVSRRGFDS